GDLDMKYLASRFQRGKEACDKFMQDKHQFHLLSTLNGLHSEVVRKQAELGSSTFLGWAKAE
ncbi:unnamed protein product, partial [Effrenium voratum]